MLNIDTGYVGDPDSLVIVPGVVSLLRRAQTLGYLLIIITNQSGIARGLYTEEDYSAVSERLRSMFAQRGIEFAGVYHCPHHPDGIGALAISCSCRKPMPGLILKAAADHGVDLARSIMIGDKQSDVDAAIAAGVGRQFLVSAHQADDAPNFTENCFAEVEHFLETSNCGSVSERLKETE